MRHGTVRHGAAFEYERMKAERKAQSHYAERTCKEALLQKGWLVRYAGFLDYICEKDDQVIFVEVKSHQGIMRHDQQDLMVKISKLGIPCFVYTPDTGFLSVPGNARSDDLGGIRSVPE